MRTLCLAGVLALAALLPAGCSSEETVREAERESLFGPPRAISEDPLNMGDDYNSRRR